MPVAGAILSSPPSTGGPTVTKILTHPIMESPGPKTPTQGQLWPRGDK